MISLLCFCSPKVPFLPGSSDLDQLSKIFETLGTPSEDSWPVSNAYKPVRMVSGKTILPLLFLKLYSQLNDFFFWNLFPC